MPGCVGVYAQTEKWTSFQAVMGCTHRLCKGGSAPGWMEYLQAGGSTRTRTFAQFKCTPFHTLVSQYAVSKGCCLFFVEMKSLITLCLWIQLRRSTTFS